MDMIKSMLNANEEEIEYFGFIPASFTMELQNSLENALFDSFNDTNKYLKGPLEESFRKNIFLFNNFVLRNILKFPPDFKLERKVTDKVIKDDVNKKIAELRRIEGQLQKRKEQLHEAKLQFIRNVNVNEGFRCLLKNYNDIITVNDTFKEVEELLYLCKNKYEEHSLKGSGLKEEFKKLMEHKYMKNEYYQNERKRLNEIAGTEEIENIVKNMKDF
ncbi:hypothetical protein NUSPORA_02760 [Nucleospora cyclopteri]